MGDVINMSERKEEAGKMLTLKVRLTGIDRMTPRMYLGAAIIAFGSAVMGIKVNVE